MNSQVSNVVEVSIAPVVPAPVLKGVLTGHPPGSSIHLTWGAIALATAYVLYKNTNGNGFLQYATITPPTLFYDDVIIDDPVAMEDSAAYYLVCETAAGISGPSNEVSN